MAEPSSELCGVPDSFQRLWTPHRMVYAEGDKPKDETGCPSCLSPAKRNENGLIVAHGEHAFVAMNLFPYSPGHLLVCPYRHVNEYVNTTAGETREMAKLTQRAIAVLAEVSQPASFDIDMNQGTTAGTEITAHLHQHVVPCWLEDMSFMLVIK